jgi:hypothetical protein
VNANARGPVNSALPAHCEGSLASLPAGGGVKSATAAPTRNLAARGTVLATAAGAVQQASAAIAAVAHQRVFVQRPRMRGRYRHSKLAGANSLSM